MPSSKSVRIPCLRATLRIACVDSPLNAISRTWLVMSHQLVDAHAAPIARLVAVAAPLALHEVGLLGDLGPQAQTPPGRAPGARTAPCTWGRPSAPSRCAMIAMTELATRNGWTPISTRRVIALGASFVCSVLKTKCPVREAWIAVSAVSTSRISPTSRMFGFCRSMARMIRAKVIPILAFTSHWFTPGQVVLDRVLGGDDLHVGPVQLVERGVQGGRLARAGRPGDQQDAVGTFDQLLEPCEVVVARSPGPGGRP